MAREKELVQQRRPAGSAPALRPKPEPPDKAAGPGRPSDLARLALAPEAGLAPVERAREMPGLQRSAGTARINRLASPGGPTASQLQGDEGEEATTTVQRQPAPGAAPEEEATTTVRRQPAPGPATEGEAAAAVRRQPAPGAMAEGDEAMTVRRQPAPAAGAPAAPAGAPAAPAVTTSPTDDLRSRSLLATLASFQNIPIDVPGTQPVPPGFIGPPAPLTVRVHVSAQYFINTAAARAHYRAARRTERFSAIIRALAARGEMSVLEGAGPRTSGRNVELGKASPTDIKRFVEEALSQGIIERYARRRRLLGARQQLTDLAPDRLQGVIQGWMRHTGVGVDCSGFVQQAAISAREAERDVAGAYNLVADLFGFGRAQLPPEISPVERSAASFTRGPRVTVPTDLRSGDAWVVSGGGHVRVVTGVREAPQPNQIRTVELDTAESSGGSTRPEPGPVARTWRTRSLTRFHPITAVGHTARSRGGTFHRIR